MSTNWQSASHRRLRTISFINLIANILLLYLMYSITSTEALSTSLQYTILSMYFIFLLVNFPLYGAFWTTSYGFYIALRGSKANPWSPIHTEKEPDRNARVAIVFAVYHEDMRRVASGMAATWESLSKNYPNISSQFDMILLSDSRKADYYVQEEWAIHLLNEKFPNSRFLYRRRPININAKIGNIYDFCRRWGKNYKYMITMDADSIISGSAITQLFRMIEGNEKIGIIQTLATPVLNESLFSRFQQFASALFDRLTAYGMQAILMGQNYYQGHNAIIRVEAFTKYCALPFLSGKKPWGGKPLSHDFAEAAMMNRAGYEVWFVPEIKGSYEENPTNLLDWLKRNQRWFQGNLQQFRLMFTENLSNVYRTIFLTAGCIYITAPIWLIFTTCGVYEIFSMNLKNIVMINTHSHYLFNLAIISMLAILAIIFLPRIMFVILIIVQKNVKDFGGYDKLFWSMILEFIISTLLMPIIALFTCYFFLQWIQGKSIQWNTQTRDDRELSFLESYKNFWWCSLIGIALWIGFFFYLQTPSGVIFLALSYSNFGKVFGGLIWIVPMLIGLTSAVFIARWSSQKFSWLKQRKILATPEEIELPEVLKMKVQWQEFFNNSLSSTISCKDGILNPWFFVRHSMQLRKRNKLEQRLNSLLNTITLDNIDTLTEQEKMMILSEKSSYEKMHWQLWQSK